MRSIRRAGRSPTFRKNPCILAVRNPRTGELASALRTILVSIRIGSARNQQDTFSNGLGGWRWGRFGGSTTQVDDYRVGFPPHGKTRLRANACDGDHSVPAFGPFCSIPRRAKDFLPVIRGE